MQHRPPIMPETYVTPPERVERLRFWVDGTPIPQGSKSLFRGRMVEANPKLPEWRRKVTEAAETALCGRLGFAKDAEIYVLFDFYFPRPKTVRRRRPTVKPDIDKNSRALLDSFTRAGVWADDSQVVSLHADQWYADDKPGVHVTIAELA